MATAERNCMMTDCARRAKEPKLRKDKEKRNLLSYLNLSEGGYIVAISW